MQYLLSTSFPMKLYPTTLYWKAWQNVMERTDYVNLLGGSLDSKNIFNFYLLNFPGQDPDNFQYLQSHIATENL